MAKVESESRLPWMRDLYGIFGKPRGTNRKPKYLGYVQASNATVALALARSYKQSQKFTLTEARPYKHLGRYRRTAIAFRRYIREVGKDAI